MNTTMVSASMKAAIRSAGDGAWPVSAMSQGSERRNRSRSTAIEPRRWLAGIRRSCWISRRGDPGQDQGSAAVRRDRADEADNE